jgi:plasmid stabilization system protein ParE
MMRFHKIMLLDSAEIDLDDAFIWYELNKPGLGIVFILEVDKSFQHILKYPQASGKQYKNTFRFVMKKFPYSIYYKLETASSQIQVLGILHHWQDPKTMKERI